MAPSNMSLLCAGLIVADAYRRTSWTDWAGPLYKKVIVGGHFCYLNDYKTAFPLKANMFQELSSRYIKN